MAPSVDITKSEISLPLSRKRKTPCTDPPSSSNDIVAVPTKTVESLKAANGSNGTNGSTETVENGTNGSTETVESETPVVSETIIQEEIITSNVSLTAQEIKETSLQAEETVDRSFMCSSHFRPARFPEVIGPLPFPKDLRKLVAWSDAFVTRLGWEALQAQESIEVLRVNLQNALEARNGLEDIIQDLQRCLHEEKDRVQDLTTDKLELEGKIEIYKEQRGKDAETIRNLLERISFLEVDNWTFNNENDILKAQNGELVAQVKAYMDQLEEAGHDRETLENAFQRWYDADKIRDEEREALNKKLAQQLKEQTELTNKADAKHKKAEAEVKRLEAERTSREKRLQEALEDLARTRDQVQDLRKQLAAAGGEKAVLEAKLNDMTARESNAQIEIKELRIQLSKAKTDFETAKADVALANEHSKKHWKTLEAIRVDGDWLLKNKGEDPCEVITVEPHCVLKVDDSRPQVYTPGFVCNHPAAEEVIMKPSNFEIVPETSA